MHATTAPAPIRILHVINSLGLGGAERFLVALVTHLDRTRFEPLVCTVADQGALVEPLRGAGITTWALAARSPYDTAALWRLRGWMRRYRPEIVHTHLFVDGLFGRVAAGLAGVPHCLATQQNSYAAQHSLPRSQIWANRLLARRTERFIAVSRGASAYLERIEHVPAAKIKIIPNAIALPVPPTEAELAACRTELGLQPGQPVIGTAARLTTQKGISTLVAACARLVQHEPHLVCLVAGEGILRGLLEAEIAQAGLSRHVRLLGERLDVKRIMGLMDVFVLPSLFEGLPVALLEAMALGIACVATDVPGTQEVICDGVDGCLVEAGNPEALAVSISGLLADAGLRTRLGQAAQRTIRSRYRIEPVASAYERIYESLARQS